MVSLYHSGHCAREFHLFVCCNNPLALQQHGENLGYTHCRYRGWLWIHQETAPELTSADDYRSSVCVPTCGRSDDDQEKVWGIGLHVLRDIQLLLKYVRGRRGHRQSIQFAWSAPPWSCTMREKSFASWYGDWPGLFSMWSYSIDAHVCIKFMNTKSWTRRIWVWTCLYLWNLMGVLVAILSRHLSNCRTMWYFSLNSRGFKFSRDLMVRFLSV